MSESDLLDEQDLRLLADLEELKWMIESLLLSGSLNVSATAQPRP